MCHGHVDARTLEREAMDRLRAARPAARSETPTENGPPPELTAGLAGVWAGVWAGVLARLRAA
ncbi:hypothetical protein HKCCSP123_19730, partial [Rhodobacterales bacterium HKCCSP123]|nr:hypothetical protein [Rhodobacterales bacterium HKCCSP123]